MQLIIEYNVHKVDDPEYIKDNICVTREDGGMSPEDFDNYIANNYFIISKLNKFLFL